MNEIIKRNKLKYLLHKLKLNNKMFFLQYEKELGERTEILCKMGLKAFKQGLDRNYKESDYDSLEVFNISNQSFLQLNSDDIVYIRYNDKRYFLLRD